MNQKWQLVALAGALAFGPAAIAAPVLSPDATPDYTQEANWLCRPGRADACAADIATTSIAANGKATLAALPTAAKPATDCFYVYPTVSMQPTPNSDLTIDTAETNVARVQFAAFRSVCRTFAPMYRQVTIKALRDALSGQPNNADRVMAYRDIVAAWNDYLARENGGRGVILIGHSQGSGLLKALIHNEIEGKPAAARVIAAYIPGNNVLVPVGKDVGGDLKSMPLCHANTQTGCVVSYVSFRDGMAPPADSRFGRTTVPGMEVACTNPARLAGGRAPLAAMLPTAIDIVDNAAPTLNWAKGVAVTTPFVALPGLLTAECATVDGAHVLTIRTEAEPNGLRTDHIGGDVMNHGKVVAAWGLHLIDVNEALGDLVKLARDQSAAWTAAHR